MDDNKIRQIVRDEIARNDNRGRFGLNSIPYHTHNGIDSPAVSQNYVVPGTRAMGSITFAQTARYTLGITFNPSSILFYGVAIDDSLYDFTLAESVSSAAAGARYRNNGKTFIVTTSVGSSDTHLYASGSGDPESSGKLTKISGDGESVIDYSSYSAPGTPTTRAFIVGNVQFGGATYYFQPGDDTSVKAGTPNYLLPNQPPIIQSCSSTVTGASGTRVFVNEYNFIRVQYPTASEADIKATATVAGYSKDSIFIDVEIDDGWSIIGNYVVT